MSEIYEKPMPAPAEGGMLLTQTAVHDLNNTAKWAKFLAVVGFIFCGLIVLIAFFIGTIFTTITSTYGGAGISAALSMCITVVYLVVAAILFVIHLFLYQFASRIGSAIVLNSTELLEKGIHRLQSYFKTLGIIMIIELSLIIIGLFFSVVSVMFLQHTV